MSHPTSLARPVQVTVSAEQRVAGVLAVSAAYPGGWAAAAPRSFYGSFPGLGRRWVSVLGAYDEHVVRDVGGLYLALMTVSVWAALRPRAETFRLVGLAWEVFCVPHLVFHAAHLSVYGVLDLVGNVVALGGTVTLAAVLLVPQRWLAARRKGRLMRVAVAGGTGLIGGMVVHALHSGGDSAVVVARSVVVDLLTGDGLDRALTGVETVIDVSNVVTTRRAAAVRFFATATRTLLAAGQRAGVTHHVVLSIVGVDRVPWGY